MYFFEESCLSLQKDGLLRRKTSFFEGRCLSSKKDIFSVLARTRSETVLRVYVVVHTFIQSFVCLISRTLVIKMQCFNNMKQAHAHGSVWRPPSWFNPKP